MPERKAEPEGQGIPQPSPGFFDQPPLNAVPGGEVIIGGSEDPDKVPGSLLSEEEWEVYNTLSQAYNSYILLERLHMVDQIEFSQGINACKNILMSRPVARELRDQRFNGYLDENGEPYGSDEITDLLTGADPE